MRRIILTVLAVLMVSGCFSMEVQEVEYSEGCVVNCIVYDDLFFRSGLSCDFSQRVCPITTTTTLKPLLVTINPYLFAFGRGCDNLGCFDIVNNEPVYFHRFDVGIDGCDKKGCFNLTTFEDHIQKTYVYNYPSNKSELPVKVLTTTTIPPDEGFFDFRAKLRRFFGLG